MGKKVYAVRKGAVPGIYFTWTECEAQVRGVSGAEYKRFNCLEEAQFWLGEAEDPSAPSGASSTDPAAAATTRPSDDDLPPWDLPEKPPETSPTSSPQPESAVPARPTSHAPPRDYHLELKEKAAAFLAHLQANGVAAYAASGGSQYHERIGIKGGGLVDLYHTRRNPFSLRPMKFEDSQLSNRVMELWRAFHHGIAGKGVAPDNTLWDAVDHYYGLLRPYAELRFDFFALASALRNAAPEAPDPESVRFDFDQIESAYRQLRPQAT